MSHNGLSQENPEEAARAAQLAAELTAEAANREIKMTYLNGAEGEKPVMVPKDPANQMKWVESAHNKGQLSETQRAHLTPEAQDAYSGWLSAREAKAARNAKVEADATAMADSARDQLDEVFADGKQQRPKGELTTDRTTGQDPQITTRLGGGKPTVPIQVPLRRGSARTGITKPGERGFDRIDDEGKVIPESPKHTGPVKRGFDVLSDDDGTQAQGKPEQGNGHELVPFGNEKQPAKVATARRRPSPGPRADHKAAQEAARDRVIAANDKIAETQQAIKDREKQKPVTSVKSEPGDGSKMAEILGNALGSKPVEPARSPADTRKTDEHPRPEVSTPATPRTEADATDTQRVPKATIEAAEAASAQPVEPEKSATTPRPEQTPAKPTPHSRAETASKPELTPDSPEIREAARSLDPQITRRLGYRIAEAVTEGDDEALLTTTAELNKYLKSAGLSDHMAGIAKGAIIDNGEIDLLALQQANALATDRPGVAKAAEHALLERLAARDRQATPEQRQQMARHALVEAVAIHNDVRNEQFAGLIAEALAAQPGTPEREAAVQRMRDFTIAEAPDMTGPQREVLIAENLARGEAAQAAANSTPETSEPKWPTQDDYNKITAPVSQQKINELDRESRRENLEKAADDFVAAIERARADRHGAGDEQVAAARRNVEQALRAQYPDETNEQLAARANALVDIAYDRYDQAQAQNAAERTGQVPRTIIDDADKAGSHQPPSPERQDQARIMRNRELARTIADIPATPENMDELVRAQAELRRHLAITNPGMSPRQIDALADQLERTADQEAAIADQALEHYGGTDPVDELARHRLAEYVKNDPRFAHASPEEQLAEYNRLLRRAHYRALRRQAEAQPDDDPSGKGPGPDAGAGTHQHTNTGTNNAGGNTNTAGPGIGENGGGRYEHYDRLLERLTAYNDAEANEDGVKLSTKERIKLLEDLEAYSNTPGIKPADALAATETFERIFQTLSERQQRKYWDREVPPEEAADPEGNWFKRTGKAIFHAPLTKQERLILRQRKEMGIDANGDSEMDYYGDLSGAPEGGFNEGDRPLQAPAERQVGQALWRASRAIHDPNLSPAERNAIANYAQWLEANYRNFDWNQLFGDQRPVGFLPRALWRPSRRRAGADEVGPVDELNDMINGAVSRAYGPPRGPQNNNGPRRPQGGRPGPTGPTGRRFRPVPQQPPVPPRPGRPTPFKRPPEPPQPGPRS